jgi:hypothetical protein
MQTEDNLNEIYEDMLNEFSGGQKLTKVAALKIFSDKELEDELKRRKKEKKK